MKPSIAGIWRKGGKHADEGGRVGIIILLHFQKAFEKLFAKLIKLCKETEIGREVVFWVESWCKKRK